MAPINKTLRGPYVSVNHPVNGEIARDVPASCVIFMILPYTLTKNNGKLFVFLPFAKLPISATLPADDFKDTT